MNQQERWQLSGTAPEVYDRYARLLMDPWVHCLVEIAQLQPGERVLDVACGTVSSLDWRPDLSEPRAE
jgi:ubiquinone/menaquinone biosynthesis C-methylase UbiE